MRNIRCIPFHDYDRLYFMELEGNYPLGTSTVD